jgi:hypothetical protein
MTSGIPRIVPKSSEGLSLEGPIHCSQVRTGSNDAAYGVSGIPYSYFPPPLYNIQSRKANQEKQVPKPIEPLGRPSILYQPLGSYDGKRYCMKSGRESKSILLLSILQV